jgi:hypothetical protein
MCVVAPVRYVHWVRVVCVYCVRAYFVCLFFLNAFQFARAPEVRVFVRVPVCVCACACLDLLLLLPSGTQHNQTNNTQTRGCARRLQVLVDATASALNLIGGSAVFPRRLPAQVRAHNPAPHCIRGLLCVCVSRALCVSCGRALWWWWCACGKLLRGDACVRAPPPMRRCL